MLTKNAQDEACLDPDLHSQSEHNGSELVAGDEESCGDTIKAGPHGETTTQSHETEVITSIQDTEDEEEYQSLLGKESDGVQSLPCTAPCEAESALQTCAGLEMSPDYLSVVDSHSGEDTDMCLEIKTVSHSLEACAESHAVQMSDSKDGVVSKCDSDKLVTTSQSEHCTQISADLNSSALFGSVGTDSEQCIIQNKCSHKTEYTPSLNNLSLNSHHSCKENVNSLQSVDEVNHVNDPQRENYLSDCSNSSSNPACSEESSQTRMASSLSLAVSVPVRSSANVSSQCLATDTQNSCHLQQKSYSVAACASVNNATVEPSPTEHSVEIRTSDNVVPVTSSCSVNEQGNSLTSIEEVGPVFQHEENPLPMYDHCQEDSLSSYKQHPTGVTEMDLEIDEEAEGVLVSPSIYQSYEENSVSSHFHASEVTDPSVTYPVIAEYNTCAGESSSSWSPVLRTCAGAADPEVLHSSAISVTHTSTQSTVTEAAVTSTTTLSSSSTQQPSSSAPITTSDQADKVVGLAVSDHEGALCTGDQTFRSDAARQSALASFLPSTQSSPFVSCVTPSSYGAAAAQGMPRPTMLSSTVQYAHHHAGGTTIMRHQSLQAGVAGSVAAHSTLLQQHGGATAVLQQRTMTNGGQTVLVQRTMTTGLGAVAQQTVMQQRLAAQAAQQAAMYQAGSARHQALQHGTVRLAHSHVMGAPVYRAQALAGAGLIRGGSPALLGQRLVRARVQGQVIPTQGSMMQHLVRQRYLGGPVMPGRVQMVAGRPVRVKMTYPREVVPMESNM